MDFTCPSCKCDNIQRLSVIFQGGLSNVNTTSIGVGGTSGGLGVFSASTSGKTQTVASLRAAPPPKKRYLKPLMGIFVLWFVISMFFVSSHHENAIVFVGLLWIVASVGWVINAFMYNSKKWPFQKETWDKSYLCNRCNEIFALTSAS